MGTYRAAVHLPGLAAGQECDIDPNAAAYLKAWIKGGYLVKVKKGAGRNG